MEAFLYALAATAIGAVAVIAYKHPDRFLGIAISLIVLAFMVAATLIAYDLGVRSGIHSGHTFLDAGETDALLRDHANKLPWYVPAGFLAFAGYVVLLMLLPLALGLQRKNKKPVDGGD